MIFTELMNAGFKISFAARDGELTLEELAEILSDLFPDYFDDVLEEVKKANKDGHYSVGEVYKILVAVVS